MRRNDDALSTLGQPDDRHCNVCSPTHSLNREPRHRSIVREATRGVVRVCTAIATPSVLGVIIGAWRNELEAVAMTVERARVSR